MREKKKKSMLNSAKLNVKVLGRLIKYVLAFYKSECIIVLFCIIISALATVAASVFMKSLIDKYIIPLTTALNPNFGPLFRALSVMAIIYLIGVMANFAYQRLMVVVSTGTMEHIRKDLFEHMEKLPIGYFDSHAHGDIMSIYTNDTDTLREVISQGIAQFLTSIITIIAVAIAMIVISLPLALLTASMVIFVQLVTKYIMGKSGQYFVLQQQQLGEENGFIEEMMEGVKVVKVFNHEEQSIADFVKINNALGESSYKANNFANILMPVVANLGNISYILSALVGGLLATHGLTGLTIGGLASYLILNRSFNLPFNQISQQLNSVIMAMAGSERIFKLLDEVPEVDEGTITLVNVQEAKDHSLEEVAAATGTWAWKNVHQDGRIDYVKLRGDVRFNDVTFSYVPGKPVLHHIDLYAEPGQKIAFVGATGAGKTTITNLINRFYDIAEGAITYDGIEIKLIKKDDLRHSLGIVLQDTHLFTGTISDNIRYACPEATTEEVEAAARLANAHSFIKHLEFGYDTVLTRDGSSLSQGQRQLLAIARAALANPPVLILDEATSSIDSRTEKLVQEGMDKLMSGRTTFVIAHRLSTIKNAHAIMVMEGGRIIERGNHESLLAKRGTYYQLYTGVIENT